MISYARSSLRFTSAKALPAFLWIVLISSSASAQTPENTTFLLGQEVGGVIDPVITVDAGATGSVEFFLQDEDDPVLGFFLVVAFGEGVSVGTFDIAGTIVEAVGAETLLQGVTEDPDGSGSTLSVGLFLDKFFPFDGQTIPPSAVPLRIGQVDITAGAQPRVVPVEFSPGIFSTTGNFLENGVFLEIPAVPPGTLVGGTIVVGEIEYVRSDCNQDGAIDVADPVFLLTYLFGGDDSPKCADACEMNLDGSLDVADVIGTLQYLFGGGSPPPAPFPTCGSDGDPFGCDEPVTCTP